MDREFKMSDPFYSIICWVIRLIPIGLMGSTSLLFHYRLPSFKHKVLIVLVVGYFSGVLSVWAYWEFAISFAPNDNLQQSFFQRRSSTVVRSIRDAFVRSGLFSADVANHLVGNQDLEAAGSGVNYAEQFSG